MDFTLNGTGIFRGSSNETIYNNLTLTKTGDDFTLDLGGNTLALTGVRSIVDAQWIDGTLTNLLVRIDCPVSYDDFTRFTGEFRK
jgi:hypothetical protein